MHLRSKRIALLSVVCVVALGAFVFFGRNVVAPASRATVTLGGTTFAVTVAQTPMEQARGLSGRESLGKNEGMLFVFPKPTLPTFWMKDMRFPIDIVWIASGTVIGIEKNVDPQIGVSEEELRLYTPPAPVESVFEIAAGEAERTGSTVGTAVLSDY